MEEDTAKVPTKQEVTEQGTKKRKSSHVKMIARKRPRPQPGDDSDDEHRKCQKIVTFDSTIDSEIMETKSFVSKLHKVSSPDGDYLVVYRVNGHFRAFNYLMKAFSLVLHSGVASSWIYAAMAGVNCWLISGAGGVIISGVGKASDGGTNGLKSASRLKSGWPGLAPCQSGIEKYGLCLLVLLMRMGDGKDIKVKKSKNKQKPTRNEETSTRERFEERYQSRISRQQEKKVNEDPIEVKGSIMTSFQKFKGSFGCFESPRTKDVKVRKIFCVSLRGGTWKAKYEKRLCAGRGYKAGVESCSPDTVAVPLFPPKPEQTQTSQIPSPVLPTSLYLVFTHLHVISMTWQPPIGLNTSPYIINGLNSKRKDPRARNDGVSHPLFILIYK
ncbi:hypothetical protein Tco_0556851 [Tanacetum coccineum]